MNIRRLSFAFMGMTMTIVVPVAAQSTAWHVEVLGDTDRSGDFSPGEIPSLRFSVAFEPGPGESHAGGKVIGFGTLLVDFLGASHWATGDVTWSANPNLTFLTGDLTKKDDSTQDLIGMQLWQIGGGEIFEIADPIWIAEIAWNPRGDYTPRRVEVAPDARPLYSDQPDDTAGIWYKGSGGFDYHLDYWPLQGVTVGFEIVPVPSDLALIAASTLLMLRRRR